MAFWVESGIFEVEFGVIVEMGWMVRWVDVVLFIDSCNISYVKRFVTSFIIHHSSLVIGRV